MAATILAPSAVFAQESLTYTYDARGRLVQVSHSGSVNAGVSATYSYDNADNRSNVTVVVPGAGVCNGVTFKVTSNGAVTEGASSVFTITKTGTATGSCTVDYATSNGTAASGSDYTTKFGTLTFTSAQPSQTVSVTTTDDSTVESAETFILTLSAATGGATLGSPSSATATINDNDSSGGTCSGVSYSVTDASVVEGGPLAFTVSKSGSASSSCTINYATADGTAISPTEYTQKQGTLTFTSSQASQTVSITTIDTSREAGSHAMYLNLTAASGGAAITDNQGLGSIVHSGTICRTCTQAVDPGAAATDSSSATGTELGDGTEPEPDPSDPPPPE